MWPSLPPSARTRSRAFRSLPPKFERNVRLAGSARIAASRTSTPRLGSLRQMNRIPLEGIAPLCRVAFRNWQNDRAPRMGAALAYYIALSLAPAGLILLAIAGFLFGAEAT